MESAWADKGIALHQLKLKRKDREGGAKVAEQLLEIFKTQRSLRLLCVLCVKKVIH